MDKITASLLNEFSEEHGISHLPESKRFEHFTASLVVGKEHSGTFESSDLVTGDDDSKGTGTDTGIDAIAVIVNDTLVCDLDELVELSDRSTYLEVDFLFVQAETSSGFEASKIGTFGFGVEDFFRDTPKLKRNERVTARAEVVRAIYERSSKFKRGNPRCRMFYVTTGKFLEDVNLDAREAGVKSDLEGLGQFQSVEFVRIGADGVQALYRHIRNAFTAEFTFLNKVTIGAEVEGVDQAYSGYLPWSEFRKIITNDSDTLQRQLFIDNVRDFQDYNGVNSEMRNTLRSSARDRFVLMNNGVTIIARRIQPTGNKFILEDYQIVNGCQTSNVLYDNRDVIDDSVLIPVRLIGTDNADITNQIIRATNRQTEVKEEQFFAIEDYAKKLESFFQAYSEAHRLYYERRSRQYNSLPIEKTRVVTFPNMVKSFASMFLNEPHRTSRNYAGLTRKVGGEIFGKDHRMEPYYVAAYALYKLEYFFRNGLLEAQYKPARFQILMAMRVLAAGFDMPSLTANKMEKYCEGLTSMLQNPEKSEALILSAAKIVEDVAGGEFTRDNIRTEPFTEKVLAALNQKLASQKSTA
jgi:hypothetical protein